MSRSPCGERGLKFDNDIADALEAGRSPCGERGLKFVDNRVPAVCRRVAPRAGSVG